jgi:hypothetical protein
MGNILATKIPTTIPSATDRGKSAPRSSSSFLTGLWNILFSISFRRMMPPTTEAETCAEVRSMWDKTKRQRFHTLCARQRQGPLTAKEQAELDGLSRDLEEMEASYLRPATARKRQEAEKLRAINVALRDVIRRRDEHLARMKATLAQ